MTRHELLPTTLVIHARDIELHANAVYIGREDGGRGKRAPRKRSPWANPWKIKVVGRDLAIELYTRWIAGDPEAASLLPRGRWHKPTIDEIRRELRGQVLACWCAPEACHGHVLAAIADNTDHAHGGATTEYRDLRKTLAGIIRSEQAEYDK